MQFAIPFPGGAESDVAARLQQRVFAQKFKQAMAVIDRAGGGGALVRQQRNALPRWRPPSP